MIFVSHSHPLSQFNGEIKTRVYDKRKQQKWPRDHDFSSFAAYRLLFLRDCK